jgi:7-cyano-7-deazaguanine synthase
MELLLLSGGLDSTALAAWRRPALALTIDYGQAPAKAEETAAREVCRELGLEHHAVSMDCRSLGSGLLAQTPALADAPSPEWWPYRNQLLVTIASAWGLPRGATSIIVGSVAGDAARHRDGTAEFYGRLAALVAMQEGEISITAPAIHLSTGELIATSGVTDAVLGWTHSCHRSNISCGACPGCAKRREALENLRSAGGDQ